MTKINAEVSCVLDCRDKLSEGIFWCPAERALYWVEVVEAMLRSAKSGRAEATGEEDVR